MTDNPFDFFDNDEDALVITPPRVTGKNVFDAFEDDELAETTVEKQPAAPAHQPLQTPPGMSVSNDPLFRDALTRIDSENKLKGVEAFARADQDAAKRGLFGDAFGILSPSEQQGWLTARREEAVSTIEGGERALKALQERYPENEDRRALYDARRLAIEEARKSLTQVEAIERGERALATKSGFRAGAESVMQSFGTATFASPVKLAGIIQGYASKLAGSKDAPDSATLYQTGKAIDEYVRGLFPGDEARQDEFGQKLSHGFGSLLSFYGAGATRLLTQGGPKTLDRLAQALPFLLGASLSATEHFDQATAKIAEGADVSEADRAWSTAAGFVLGLTEALPVIGTMQASRLSGTGAFAERMGRIGKQAAIGATEEAAQETFQSVMSDVVAREFYDPEREIGETAAEEGLIGGILGGGMRGGAATIREARVRVAPQTSPSTPGAPVDQGQQVARESKQDMLDVEPPVEGAQDAVAGAETGVVDAESVGQPEGALPVTEEAVGDMGIPISEETQGATAQLAPEQQVYEQETILPAIEEIDAEVGSPVLADAYSRLTPDEKSEIISRISENEENIADLIEEIAIRNEDAPTLAAMAIRRGLNDEQIAQVRQLIAQQSPELAAGFDELVASLPKPRQARQPKQRAAPALSQERQAAASDYASRLQSSIDDKSSFDAVLAAASKALKKPELEAAAREFLGYDATFRTKAEAVNALKQRQADWVIGGAQTETIARDFDEAAARREASDREGQERPRLSFPKSMSARPSRYRTGEQAEPAPRRKEPGSTLQDFARASSASEIAERFNILQEDAASLLKRNAFTGEAKTIVERLAKKAAEGNKHAQNNDWETLGQTVGDMASDAAALTELDARPEARLITQWVNTASRLAREGRIPVPERAAAQPSAINQQISDAYWRLTPRPQSWVSMRELRAALPDIPRAELDAALTDMYLGKAINLANQDDQGSLTQADRDASMRLGGASRIDILSMQSPFAEAAPPDADPAQLRRQFASILNSRTPRSKWASELGIDEAQLAPLIEEAIRKGFLRRDKNGNVRRVPQSQRSGSFAAMVIPDNLPETMPGEGDVALTPEAEEVWPEAKAAINRAASAILPDAVKVDVVDNIAIATLRKEDQMLALREEAAFRAWFGDSKVVDENGEPLVVYHGTRRDFEAFLETVQRENDGGFYGRGFYFSESPGEAEYYATLKSDEGSNIVAVYLSIQNPFEIKDGGEVSNIVPRFFDQIRGMDGIPPSIKSAMDQWDAAASQVEVEQINFWNEERFKETGDGSEIKYKDAKSAAARLFETEEQAKNTLTYLGLPRFPMGIDALIVSSDPSAFRDFLRQNGYDGVHMGDEWVAFDPTQIKSVFNRGTFDPTDPRISYALRKTKPSESAIDEETGDQPLGPRLRAGSRTLGADGEVIAGRPSREAKQDADGREGQIARQPDGRTETWGIPGFSGFVTAEKPQKGRIASLLYRVYPEGTILPDGNRDVAKQIGKSLGFARISQHPDGAWEISFIQKNADKAGKGFAQKIYDAIEADLGITISPSGWLTKEGYEQIWQKRDPEAVRHHRWSQKNGHYLSPRALWDQLGNAQTRLAAAERRNDAEDAAFIKAERGEILKLYMQLPPEARAPNGRDQMFALRAFHGSPHDFDRFDLSRIGTGEGAQAFGRGLYFAENEGVARSYQASVPYQTIKRDFREALPDDAEFDEVMDLVNEGGNFTPYQERVLRALDADDWLGFDYPSQAISAAYSGRLDNWDPSPELREAIDASGNLYEVEIDVEPEQLLDWDKPLSEQSEEIQQIIRERYADLLEQEAAPYRKYDETFSPWENLYGYNLYNAILNRTAPDPIDTDSLGRAAGASRDAAAVDLREAGIPGLRYLDAGSRDAGDGTRNIVIFDDSLVKITAKNGKPVSAEERQGVVDQMLALRGFYSPAIRAAENISQKKGTGEQFLKQISKAPGVKKDELEWMGLEEFLADKKSITKDEVLAFMRAHQVKLDEKELGANESQDVTSLAQERFNHDFSDNSESFNEWLFEVSHSDPIKSEYISKYGEDAFDDASPTEIIRAVEGNPALNRYRHEAWAEFQNNYIEDAVRDTREIAIENDVEPTKFSSYKVPGGENYREFIIELPGWEYNEPHFGGPVLVHFRADDRIGPNGERIFFIHEIQATGHQKGRRFGYGDLGSINKELRDLSRERDALQAEIMQELHHRFPKLPDDASYDDKQARIIAVAGDEDYKAFRLVRSEKINDLNRKIADIEENSKYLTPHAPFKGDLWLELALKRALLYATENGYDAISWARSDQIAKAVGAEPQSLTLQYDSKIGKFLDKYTRKWGGKVETSKGIAGRVRRNDETGLAEREITRPGNLFGAIDTQDGVDPSLLYRAADLATDDTVDTALRDAGQAITESPDVHEIINALPSAAREHLENVFRNEQAALDVNPILRLTPEMRSSVMEGQPLAMRRQPPAQQAEALGQTDPYAMKISIAMRAVEAEAKAKGVSTVQEAVRVLRHEAVEFFKAMGIFTEKEWNTLKTAARRNGWVETTGVREAYESVYKDGMSETELNDLLIKEAIAEQYSEFHLNRKQFKGTIGAVFQRIKDFIDRVANFMRGEGFQTWDDVFTRIDQGEFKARFEEAFPDLAPQRRTDTAAMQATAGKIPDSPARRATAGTERPAQSLADLVNAFNKALGLTVRQGRLDPGLKRAASQMGTDVRGQTSMATGVVRLRVPNEIDTLAHEGGHALENRFKGDLEAIKQAHAAELTPLASPGPDALSEGFAEWFRRYVTNPAASKRTAPGFEQEFEDFLDAQDPTMLAGLQSIRDGYQEWINAPSGGAVASSITTTVAPGSLKEVVREFKEEGLRNTFQNWTDRIYTAVFDDLHPMRLAVDGLLEIAKKNVKPSLRKNLDVKATDNAYKLLRLARDGYAAGHMDLLHGVHDYKSITPTGPSLRAAIATAFGGFDKSQWNEQISTDFGAYLVSRRMVQEWARFQNGDLSAPPDKFSLADHQQSIKGFEAKYPGFAQGAQQVYEYLNNMLRKKRDAGLITSELYDELVGRQDYVPVMRDMSDRGGVEGRSAARKDKYSVISRFRGSQRDVINPLESIAKDSYETAMIIARNDALKALDALARAAGPDGGKFAERIPAHEMKATQVNVREAIKAAARDAGVDPADMQIMLQAVDDQLGDNTVAQIWRAGEISEKGEAIVYLWENGERIPIRLDDGKFGHDMLHAVTGLNREAEGWWVNLLSLPSTGLRIGVTASLDFIGANFIRDQVSAWVLTRDFVPFYDGARGIYNDLTLSDVSRIYSRVGGIMGGANVAAQHESRIKREILQLRRKGIRFTLNPLTRDFWRMTEFAETGTRLAVFERAFERGKTDGLTDWEASIEAAFVARDYIDFGRRGSRMLAARKLIPFFNAALQGLDRGIRGMRGRVDADKVLRTVISPYIKSRTGQPLTEVEQGNKKQAAQAWGYMVALGMVGLGLSLIYKDDEEYEEISDYIKATHWLFRVNGEWVRIPKPFELAFFSNLVERTFDYVYKDDPTALERFGSGLLEITVPPHSIPGLAVTTELITDYSFFSGRPLVGPFLKSLPPELQFNAYASEFSKYLGKQVGISPAYIDHFITGFGASYGREFVNASDMFMPALGKATGGAFGLPTGPVADPALQDYFFIRRFTTDPTRGSISVRQFWDMMSMENGKFIQAANGYKHLVDKVRDAYGAQEFLDRLPDEERAYALLNAGNSGNRARYRRLHPLERAKEITSVASGMKKEINLSRLYKGGKGEQIELTPQQMRTVSDLLSDITMREARNALIALGVRGWEQKKPIEVETVYEEIKAAAPDVHKELVSRLKSKRLPSYADVVKGWPIARERILEDGQKAIISDLYRRDFSIGEGAPLQ